MRTAQVIVDEYLSKGKTEKYIRIVASTRSEKLKQDINELLDEKFGKRKCCNGSIPEKEKGEVR